MVSKITQWDDLVSRTESKMLERLQYMVPFLKSDFSCPRGGFDQIILNLETAKVDLSRSSVNNHLTWLRIAMNYFLGSENDKKEAESRHDNGHYSGKLLRDLLKRGITHNDLKLEEMIVILKENDLKVYKIPKEKKPSENIHKSTALAKRNGHSGKIVTSKTANQSAINLSNPIINGVILDNVIQEVQEEVKILVTARDIIIKRLSRRAT